MQNLTILIATDFSEGYTALLKKAIDFAKKKQAKLHVLHVIEKTFFKKKNLDSIKEHCWNTLLSEYPTLSKEQFHCLEGNPEKVISIVAQTIDARIILIGDNRNKHPMEAIFMGSDTKAIIRESRVPVLVTKKPEYTDYETILIPTDLSNDSLEMIQHIAILFPHAYLILLHLYSVPFEFRLGMYGFNDDEISNFKEESRVGAESELNLFIRKLNIPAKKIIPIVRKDLLSSERFEDHHKDLKADLVAIHTIGQISFFAFDLLEKSTNDVLVYKITRG